VCHWQLISTSSGSGDLFVYRIVVKPCRLVVKLEAISFFSVFECNQYLRNCDLNNILNNSYAILL